MYIDKMLKYMVNYFKSTKIFYFIHKILRLDVSQKQPAQPMHILINPMVGYNYEHTGKTITTMVSNILILS